MPILPTFAVLCAMARAEIEAEPTIDDGEWVERIKCRLVRQRFAYPRPDELTRALRAVEQALAKTCGPRPTPQRTVVERPADYVPPTRAEAAAFIGEIAKDVIKPMPKARALTVRDVRAAERQKALRIVLDAIREQSARCDEAERVAAEAKERD